MIKILDFKRCKAFLAMVLVLCQLFSIFGMAMPFKIDDAKAWDGAGTLGVNYWVKLRVHKVDDSADKNYVSGARLRLTDGPWATEESSFYYEQWTSTDTYYEVNYLLVNGDIELTYDDSLSLYSLTDSGTIVEMSAPEGYEKADPITFVTKDFIEELFGNGDITIGEALTVSDSTGGIWSAEYWYPEPIDIYVVNEKKTIENPNNKNDEPNRPLSTDNEVVNNGEDIVVTFENEIYTVQNLTVSKTVKEEKLGGQFVNSTTTDEFQFTAYFSGMEAGDSFTATKGEESVGTITSDESGNATFNFSLKNGESLVFNEMSAGTQYQIEEAATNYEPSFVLSGLNVNPEKNVQTGNRNEALKTELETIEAREEGRVDFTNVKRLDFGKLVVEKKVEGNAPAGEKFEFTITLTGDEIEGEQTFNDVEFTDGVATIELAAGESKDFDIPAGTTYKVEETKYTNYETNYSMEVVDPYAISVTNLGTDGATARFFIHKVDENGNPVYGAKLQVINNQTGEIEAEWVTSEEHGVRYHDELQQNVIGYEYQTIYEYFGTFPDGQKTDTYTIREVETPDGYETAADVIILMQDLIDGAYHDDTYNIDIVCVVDNNVITPVEPITYMTGFISKDKYDVVTVTNTYTAVDITLSKTVDNPEVMIDNEKFVIEGTFSNLEANKTYEISNGFTMTADENGNASYVARLENGEKIVFKGIPVDTVYSFEEKEGNYIASYEIVDKNK